LEVCESLISGREEEIKWLKEQIEEHTKAVLDGNGRVRALKESEEELLEKIKEENVGFEEE